jgi:hypothetical protein
MKKLLVIMAVLLVCGMARAQDQEVRKEAKNFLAFHAGPSFPVDHFGRTTMINPGHGLNINSQSGFAQTGLRLGLDYTHLITPNLGLGVNAFYNSHTLNNRAYVNQLNQLFSDPEITVDLTGFRLNHWQWYGVSAGPAVQWAFPGSARIMAGGYVMGGIANVNSPEATYQGMVMAAEDWAIAPVFQAGINIRKMAGQKLFIQVGADYNYLKPEFNMQYNDGDLMVEEKTNQKIAVINVTGGVGIRF